MTDNQFRKFLANAPALDFPIGGGDSIPPQHREGYEKIVKETSTPEEYADYQANLAQQREVSAKMRVVSEPKIDQYVKDKYDVDLYHGPVTKNDEETARGIYQDLGAVDPSKRDVKPGFRKREK